jgi:hypothetical protein
MRVICRSVAGVRHHGQPMRVETLVNPNLP